MADCLFCRIVEGKVLANVVYRDAQCIGFDDIHPAAPVHVLFVPKRHLEGVNTLTEADRAEAGQLFLAAAAYARQRGLEASGYRVVADAAPTPAKASFTSTCTCWGESPSTSTRTPGAGTSLRTLADGPASAMQPLAMKPAPC